MFEALPKSSLRILLISDKDLLGGILSENKLVPILLICNRKNKNKLININIIINNNNNKVIAKNNKSN